MITLHTALWNAATHLQQRAVKLLVLLLVSLPLLLSGCQSDRALPTSGEYDPSVESYDHAFAALMRKWDIPGGALAVMKDGQLLLARGYGLADVERAEPVQPDTLFRIASVSKPITAVAVLKLVEEGRLSLDTPAFSLLDEFQPPAGKDPDPRIATITIRQLLQHAGGWDSAQSFDPMFRSSEAAQEVGAPAPADCPTTIRYMLGQPLDFDPGSRYAYSNLGYCVLGRIIEEVTGETYADYVQHQVLAPMGIERMHLGRSLLSGRQPGEVRYYDDEGAPLAPSVFPDQGSPTPWPYGGFHLEAMDAHGGWIGSATDLGRFAWAVDQANPTAALKPATLTLMLSRPPAPLWEGKSDYYALGWRVLSSPELK